MADGNEVIGERATSSPESVASDNVDNDSSNNSSQQQEANPMYPSNSLHFSGVRSSRGSGILQPSRMGNLPHPNGSTQGPQLFGARNPVTSYLMPACNPFAPRQTMSSGGGGFESSLTGTSGSSPHFSLRPSTLSNQTIAMSTDSPSGGYKSSFVLEPPKFESPLHGARGPLTSTDGLPCPPENLDVSHPPDVSSSLLPGDGLQRRLFGDGDVAAASNGENSAPTTENYFAQFDAEKRENVVTESKPTREEEDSQAQGEFVFGQKMENRATASAHSSGTNHVNGFSVGGAESSEPTCAEFVFGQNLADRVVVQPNLTLSDNSESVQESNDETATPSTSVSQSLAESAAAQQARLASRHVPDEVEVKTGEEDESNVFQVNAKLFLFEKETRDWAEKGRGIMRLNDMLTAGMNGNETQTFQSRLVMRVESTKRVILNTMIWPGMKVERPSEKNVRFTAVDGEEGCKIFLITAQPKDVDMIFNAIESRVLRLKRQSEEQERVEAMRGGSEQNEEGSERKAEPGVARRAEPGVARCKVGRESGEPDGECRGPDEASKGPDGECIDADGECREPDGASRGPDGAVGAETNSSIRAPKRKCSSPIPSAPRKRAELEHSVSSEGNDSSTVDPEETEASSESYASSSSTSNPSGES